MNDQNRDKIQIKRMLQAGGNFKFVAQNVACIYFVLMKDYDGDLLSEDKRLFATALFDMWSYISEGSIDFDGIKEIVTRSFVKDIVIGHKEDENNININKELVNLTMQILIRIFLIDTDVEYKYIVKNVEDNKESISNMIDKTLNEGEKCALYNDVLYNVTIFLTYDIVKNAIFYFDSYYEE